MRSEVGGVALHLQALVELPALDALRDPAAVPVEHALTQAVQSVGHVLRLVLGDYVLVHQHERALVVTAAAGLLWLVAARKVQRDEVPGEVEDVDDVLDLGAGGEELSVDARENVADLDARFERQQGKAVAARVQRVNANLRVDLLDGDAELLAAPTEDDGEVCSHGVEAVNH